MEFLFFVAKYIIDDDFYQCLCGVASVNKIAGFWSWRLRGYVVNCMF